MELDPPVFPKRTGTYKIGETGYRAQITLLSWVNGAFVPFHKYGRLIPPGEWKPFIEYKGTLVGDRISWSLHVNRGDGYHFCSGYSCPEDCAYQILSSIEEEDREFYLENLVVGIS